MITGVAAIEHRWIKNEDPPGVRHGGTIHDQLGRYLPSVFDVAHDAGVSTGMFVGKPKFWLLQQSYGHTRVANPVTRESERKSKLDLFVLAESESALVDQLIARLARAGADSKAHT